MAQRERVPHAPLGVALQGPVLHQAVPRGELLQWGLPQGVGAVSRAVVGAEVAEAAWARAEPVWGLLGSTSPGQDPRWHPSPLATEGAVGAVECHRGEEYHPGAEAGQRC